MRSITASLALVFSLSLASTSSAQDTNCSAIFNEFLPTATSPNAFQKCYTDQVYNTELVAQGGMPDYADVIAKVCNRPACSHSTLASATTKYMDACSASIDVEAANGNILQLGKTALEVFFAEPLRGVYCILDPNAVTLPPPVVNRPVYCLAKDVADPAGRFVTNLAVYLTSGAIRSSQDPFFASLDPKDTCSPCSQLALNETVHFLAQTLMPKIAPFYTPEFVQYWSKLIPAYNALCKTSIVQTWPEGTLNQTVAGVPTGTPTAPVVALPTASAPAPATPSVSKNGCQIAAAPTTKGVALAMFAAVIGLF
ncbi:hypothetical protein BG006_001854 [Podila minutissima]|uniref:Uncharacterized protein n=1 Tax=Podila minutissima TaxID=64525 RepID=A0A9P5SCN8_9FUNG|nr:hypothetical protein BG006_001854 [Podila minutissima]